MGLSEEIRQRLINSFKTEQSEHIQKINQGLLVLEKNPQQADRQSLLNDIFREAHSLKGAARAVGLTTIEGLGHALEELLLQAKDGRLAFSPELFDLLYQTLDAIESITAHVEAGEASPSPEVIALLARLNDATRGQGIGAGNQAAGTGKKEPGLRAQATRKQQRKPKNKPDNGETLVKEPVQIKPEPVQEAPDTSKAGEKTETVEGELPPPPDPQPSISNPPAPAPSPQSDETIRVSVAKLDALMAQFSELLGAKIRAEQRLAEVRQMQVFAAEWQKSWLSLRTTYNRLARSAQLVQSEPGLDSLLRTRGNGANGHSRPAVDPYAELQVNDLRESKNSDGWAAPQILTKELATLLNFAAHNQEQLRAFTSQASILYRQLANDTMRLSLIMDDLQEEIKRVRMLPLVTITPTFGRMVRDLAREQNKQINFTITGGETELDKRVLEQIKDPLIHLLRNAVDHGLETPEKRRAAGKPAEGQISLSASQQGNNIVITVADDGDGLDLAAIRLVAVRRGLLSAAEAQKLNDSDTANLIFNSGLSTSKIITDISGRGVGLDVVRQNVEELHGALEVTSLPGQGTTFTLTLPLTLASSRGLLVQVGKRLFAPPLSTVERMLQIDRSAIANVEGKEAITYQGKPIALAWLEELLELPPSNRDIDRLTIVIITVAEKRLGLIVDGLAGEQEIVMKGLGKQLVRVGGIAGATVLGSGQVILVLYPADLVKLANRTRARGLQATTKKEAEQVKTILVVDDSITTRTLEKNILEAAGYEVRLATDGEEALGMLGSNGLPNLIISDINMPYLDGFELTERVKRDSRYSNIPVILVTSLDTPADKARGIEVGADAYIVKSSFDQGNLLETIEQLV